MGARNRIEIGLSYRPARLHQPGGSVYVESILGLLISLKIGAQNRLQFGIHVYNHKSST
jgi:hypothetical protein